MDRTERQQRLIDLIWGRHRIDNKSFAAEASDLSANQNLRPRNQCPGCDGFFQKKHMIRKLIQGHGEDAEVAGWEFKCPHCQCKLTVFND